MIAAANFVGLPLMFLSAILIPPTQMPGWIAQISRFNPVNWGVHAARNAIVTGGALGRDRRLSPAAARGGRRHVVVRDVVLPRRTSARSDVSSTQMTCPAATGPPIAIEKLRDDAAVRRAHLVLHLHRLDDAEHLTGLDRVAVGDGDGQHRSLHRRDDRVAARRRRLRARAPLRRRASSRHGCSGSSTRTSKRRPSTSTVRARSTVAPVRRAAPTGPEPSSSAARAASSSDSTSPWHVSPRTKHSCESSALWKPSSVFGPSITNSSSARSIRRARVLAVDAVHDQLRDHRVVDAGDLVARRDARVDAHARSRRLAIRGHETRRRQEARAPRPPR